MIATCKFRLETEKDEFDMPEDSDVLGQGPKFNLVKSQLFSILTPK